MNIQDIFKIDSYNELQDLLQSVKVIVPESREELCRLTFGNSDTDFFEVAYDVPDKGRVVEATVTRCKNGASVNYPDIYMRRRDPDCMVVADDQETDKEKYFERYQGDFESIRKEAFDWLKNQEELIVMPFMSGGNQLGYPSILIAPTNAGFFATGLSDLQFFIPRKDIPEVFTPRAIIYLAPPFRHTHFDGKQVVVHNRLQTLHELFSFNLYPGPSAKKGVYGFLLNIGEQENWVTLHASCVKIVTPYENEFTIMHEGASGSGKSEMTEQIHRESDGRLLVSENITNEEKYYLKMAETSELMPVTDDMALCHPKIQNAKRRLVITDAENGWFLRVDHINRYGKEPHLEGLTIHPKEPLVFLNLDTPPKSTALIWEHAIDEPGKTCPNPRVIMPKKLVPHSLSEPVEIDIRSFGVRTPPSTLENPNYGILGIFHILPPALAWLWRLAAPRGHANPSITSSAGLSSEGVGSYWPFATGKKVIQANLLLQQILDTPDTKYILIPNQYIGAYKVGFMAEWLTREYLARRGSLKLKPQQIKNARCPLLGYALSSMKVEGEYLPHHLLEANLQSEVTDEGYDQGAEILYNFFCREVKQFLNKDLDPRGKKIIETCLNKGSLQDYLKIIPFNLSE
ncbi:MAG: DUF4914 family protein [Spirochaetes bacterium]|nr:DUF4914 family protein [Spirochaetota bacterium]